MKRSLCLTLTLAAGLVAGPVFAAQSPSDDLTAYHEAGAAKIQAQLAELHAAATNAKRIKVQGNNVYPGTPLANEFRAYPPSCAAWPLPDKPSGPSSQIWSQRVPLFATSAAGGRIETVTVTVWRIACSSTGGLTPYNRDNGFNAMTLMRIDRDAANEGNKAVVTTFPNVQIKQGNIDFPAAESLVRAATEPNTYLSATPFNALMVYSTTYVLENYSETALHYFNEAFTLRINPILTGVDPIDFQIPAYSPSPSTYPDAYAPLPLDGYSAAQWFNAEFGEGLLVQVTEQLQSNGSTVRQLVFDLLTKDTNNDPLWLVGNAAFTVGQSSITIDANYLGNDLAQVPWGTMAFEVTDCNHMRVTFTPRAGLPAPIPSINGTTTYDRLFTPNGMTCE